MTDEIKTKPTIKIRSIDIIDDAQRQGTALIIETSSALCTTVPPAYIQDAILDEIERFEDVVEIREAYNLDMVDGFAIGVIFKISATIVPYNEELRDDVARAVVKAVKRFGDLVDLAGD